MSTEVEKRPNDHELGLMAELIDISVLHVMGPGGSMS